MRRPVRTSARPSSAGRLFRSLFFRFVFEPIVSSRPAGTHGSLLCFIVCVSRVLANSSGRADCACLPATHVTTLLENGHTRTGDDNFVQRACVCTARCPTSCIPTECAWTATHGRRVDWRSNERCSKFLDYGFTEHLYDATDLTSHAESQGLRPARTSGLVITQRLPQKKKPVQTVLVHEECLRTRSACARGVLAHDLMSALEDDTAMHVLLQAQWLTVGALVRVSMTSHRMRAQLQSFLPQLIGLRSCTTFAALSITMGAPRRCIECGAYNKGRPRATRLKRLQLQSTRSQHPLTGRLCLRCARDDGGFRFCFTRQEVRAAIFKAAASGQYAPLPRAWERHRLADAVALTRTHQYLYPPSTLDIIARRARLQKTPSAGGS